MLCYQVRADEGLTLVLQARRLLRLRRLHRGLPAARRCVACHVHTVEAIVAQLDLLDERVTYLPAARGHAHAALTCMAA